MRNGKQRGFTLLGLLFLIAGLGVAMAALGVVWQTFNQREKERELLFVGEQFRSALDSYRRATPAGQPSAPASLEALLADNRFPNTVRHLRRLWPDPMTGKTEWGLARDERGGITAVFSLSEGEPFKTAGFGKAQDGFAEAKTYRDWVFKATPEAAKDGQPDLAADVAARDAETLRKYEADKKRRMACGDEMNRQLAACRTGEDEVQVDPACVQAAETRFQACIGGA